LLTAITGFGRAIRGFGRGGSMIAGFWTAVLTWPVIAAGSAPTSAAAPLATGALAALTRMRFGRFRLSIGIRFFRFIPASEPRSDARQQPFLRR
jgi:hypothetical protein